ncbi:MAG: flagellar basal-body rod protein FlgG [Chlamydiales bacterium]|jgi:flagellar basal-body rod protein FlgG|nr:flagellar basal-body rod protein FlgG [Chlamydiales bacterium]
MIKALFTSSTGMKGQMTKLDVISNNLANASTVGFKKARASFQDLIYETLKEAGEKTGPNSESPVGQQIGSGTKLVGITKQFSLGSLSRTDRDLDVAIAGSGFIVVTGPDGTDHYTRDGSLKLSGNGDIVNSEGYAVKGLGQIPKNARSINFSPNGDVGYVDQTGQEISIGGIQLAMFTNPSGLSALGGNLYKDSSASGNPFLVTPGEESSGLIQQHFLELSNVNIVEEMVEMISSQRAYEVNSKVIKAADEMSSTANQLTR